MNQNSIFWKNSNNNNLLRGVTFQTLFDGSPTRQSAFRPKDHFLRCIDEGTPGGIHMAGSGILNPQAEDDLAGYIEGVYSHEGCGACKLYTKQQGLEETDADTLGDESAKQLAAKLGVPYLGRISYDKMQRPQHLHVARCIYYDGTGHFDPSQIKELPSGFVISRKYINSGYAQKEVDIAIKIALSDHGFGKLFTPDTPLYLVAVSKDEPGSVPGDTLLKELSDYTKIYPNIKIEVIYG